MIHTAPGSIHMLFTQTSGWTAAQHLRSSSPVVFEHERALYYHVERSSPERFTFKTTTTRKQIRERDRDKLLWQQQRFALLKFKERKRSEKRFMHALNVFTGPQFFCFTLNRSFNDLHVAKHLCNCAQLF